MSMNCRMTCLLVPRIRPWLEEWCRLGQVNFLGPGRGRLGVSAGGNFSTSNLPTRFLPWRVSIRYRAARAESDRYLQAAAASYRLQLCVVWWYVLAASIDVPCEALMLMLCYAMLCHADWQQLQATRQSSCLAARIWEKRCIYEEDLFLLPPLVSRFLVFRLSASSYPLRLRLRVILAATWGGGYVRSVILASSDAFETEESTGPSKRGMIPLSLPASTVFAIWHLPSRSSKKIWVNLTWTHTSRFNHQFSSSPTHLPQGNLPFSESEPSSWILMYKAEHQILGIGLLRVLDLCVRPHR